MINCKWPDATIVPFGSFPAGLSTFTSDIDITVHNTDTQLGGTQSILSVPMSGKVGLSHNDDLFVTDFTNDEEYVDDIERGQIVTSSKIANESGFVNDFDGSIDETDLAKPSHSSIVKEREQTSTSSNKRRKFELDISHDVMFNVKEMVQMQIPVTNASDTPKTRTAAALDRDLIVHVESGSDDDSSEYNNANTDEHIDRLCSSTNGKAHYKTMIDLTDLEDGGRLDHFQTTGKAAITHDEKLKEQELKRMAVDELRSLFPYMVVSY